MAELVTKVEKVESLIASCMRAAGFEYLAVDFDTVRKGMSADKTLPGLSEEQYVDQHGFGITTFYTGNAPQLAAVTTPSIIGLGERNVRIFNNLATTDQVAYSRTLLGEHLDATFAVALEAEDFSRTGGCTRTAIEQVFNPEELKAAYRNPKDVLIQQDRRMIAALEKFAECVRKKGFDYKHPDDLDRSLKDRLDAITGGAPVEALSAEAKAALKELQVHERAAAPVVFECEGEIVDPVAEQIEKELYAGIQR